MLGEMRAPIFLFFLASVGCGGLVEQESGKTTVGATGTDGGVTSSDSGATVTKPADGGGTVPACAPGGDMGGITGSACRALTDLRAEAEANCKRTGIATFTPQQSCATFYRYREYTCCVGSVCGPKVRDGGPSSCKDVETWTNYSVGDCARDGKTLGTIEFFEPCGDTAGYKGYSYTCCAG
jgi:hypothetical protein